MWNLVDKRYEKLLVLEYGFKSKSGSIKWKCLCDCGNITFVETSKLVNNKTKSCGCLARELSKLRKTKHGQYGTPTYKSWQGMLQRCYNLNDDHFQNYGARGIIVHESWRNSFETFYSDMGERLSGLTLERKDVNGNYEPNNCIWATREIQANNRRDTRKICFNGELKPLAHWIKHFKLNANIVQAKYNRGIRNPADLFWPALCKVIKRI